MLFWLFTSVKKKITIIKIKIKKQKETKKISLAYYFYFAAVETQLHWSKQTWV